jgi:hypothetical protein
MKPVVSVLVTVFDMPVQAMNTLMSLQADYQFDAPEHDYEVIVVENKSSNCLNGKDVEALGKNFHYFLREESGVSPAAAINFAATHAQGQYVGLVIDGARMLSPGVIKYVLAATRMYDAPLVAVPGYELKSPVSATAPQRTEWEKSQLTSIDWNNNGYRLFEQAQFSEGNLQGYFHPLMECSALFCQRSAFEQIGGANIEFNKPGGGSLNLHIYRSLGLISRAQLVILPGEGSFHQFHSGVTTRSYEDRERTITEFNDQLNSFWDGQYKALTREPIYLGKVCAAAQPFLQRSCENGINRHKRFSGSHEDPWIDDSILARSRSIK